MLNSKLEKIRSLGKEETEDFSASDFNFKQILKNIIANKKKVIDAHIATSRQTRLGPSVSSGFCVSENRADSEYISLMESCTQKDKETNAAPMGMLNETFICLIKLANRKKIYVPIPPTFLVEQTHIYYFFNDPAKGYITVEIYTFLSFKELRELVAQKLLEPGSPGPALVLKYSDYYSNDIVVKTYISDKDCVDEFIRCRDGSGVALIQSYVLSSALEKSIFRAFCFGGKPKIFSVTPKKKSKIPELNAKSFSEYSRDYSKYYATKIREGALRLVERKAEELYQVFQEEVFKREGLLLEGVALDFIQHRSGNFYFLI